MTVKIQIVVSWFMRAYSPAA